MCVLVIYFCVETTPPVSSLRNALLFLTLLWVFTLRVSSLLGVPHMVAVQWWLGLQSSDDSTGLGGHDGSFT